MNFYDNFMVHRSLKGLKKELEFSENNSLLFVLIVFPFQFFLLVKERYAPYNGQMVFGYLLVTRPILNVVLVSCNEEVSLKVLIMWISLPISGHNGNGQLSEVRET